jgi:NHLM bacteriocin system ABC transporter ATP-binding protein
MRGESRHDDFWAHEGDVIAAGANVPIALSDPEILWRVDEGAVDVFSRRRHEQSETGPRRYLWSSAAGSCLLGFDGEDVELLAVGTSGTRLRRLSVARVREIVRDPDSLPYVRPLVEGFVTDLSRADQTLRRPQLNVLLRPGNEYTLTAGQRTGADRVPVWVQIRAGTLRFAGSEDVVVEAGDGMLPLGPGLWLEAVSDDVRLETVDTDQALHSGGALAGLSRLRALFIALATAEMQRESAAERERLLRKASSDRRSRERALTSFASLLTPIESAVEAAETEDNLLAACRIVGAPAGIRFKAPPRWETATRTREALPAICRASGVRYRQVRLTGKWWRKDAGQLLGSWADTEEPVALVRRGRRYWAVDPEDGSSRPLTEELRRRLLKLAFVFYRPFPNEPIGGRDLLRMALGDLRPDLRDILLLGLIAGLLGLLMPIATGQMVGSVIPSARPDQVLTLALALVAVHLGVALFDLARAFLLVRVEGESNAVLQAGVVDRMLALPVPFFRAFPVGDLTQRAFSINTARTLLSGATATSILAGIFSALNFLLMLYYDWRLALLATLVFLVALAVVVGLSLPAVRLQRKALDVQGRVGALVFQLIGGIAKLRVAGAESRAFAEWAERFREEKELTYRQRSYQIGVKVFNDVLPLLASLSLFAAAGHLMNTGHSLDTAAFIAFNAAFGTFFAAAVQLSNTVNVVLSVKPTIDRAKPILQAVPEVDAAKPDPGELMGRIEVDHLHFRYEEDGPLILHDVSFAAEPGEFVALVGPSGSGKSTTMRLLLGFEQPASGVLYFDGQDLASVDVSAVRSQIGVVLQDSRLTHGSIFDNIVGTAPLAIDDAWEAAEMAGIADDIRAMPMQMHTIVAEGGATFSGGQQQRLLIARALVRKPRIVFFDEATSALDNASQQLVSNSLDALHTTRIVVAHRLSTIRHADRICVMQNGRLVQMGTFDELVAKPGLFADLAARQRL